MPDELLPSAAAQFLARHIATVEELEILLLLGNDASKARTTEEIYQVIKSSRKSVELGLEKFVAAGLVTANSARFSISPLPAHSGIHELIRLYRESPVRVICAIYQPPRDSAQDFADAFKLRRDP